MRKILFTFLLVSIGLSMAAAAPAGSKKTTPHPVQRVDPPNWWTGMVEDEVELLFYGKDIQSYSITLNNEHSRILGIEKAPNPDYLYIKVQITALQQAGNLIFEVSKDRKKFTYSYPILANNSYQPAGISDKDLIYLVFPDRFSNGDTGNDALPSMEEKTCDRQALKGRHGGDLQGILNHLDHFTELGTGALWINPVLENNQPYESYHGYAATDLYKVDPRLGSNELYRQVTDACHKAGIKMIWDVVYNHWGNRNWLFKNLPDSNWVHWFPEFTRTSYRAEVLMDPYASEADKKIMSDAWFDTHMPDLNQQDPHLARYLIQNSIWWIEYAGIDAFRIDTYAYPDQQFMRDLDNAIRREYPEFVLFGETWVQGSPVQAWFTENAFVEKNFNSALHGVTDFQLYYAINKGLNENFGWEEGFRRIELTLAHDILYQNPSMLVTFLDNHDLSRFFSVVGEDLGKYKMGLALLYTLRGIPSIYYGSEIAMKNFADPDARVREDYPGGFPGDTVNKFTRDGRNPLENEVFDLCKNLGMWRKNNSWMASGKLTQFVPENNTYVYFRHAEGRILMCLFNGNDQTTEISTGRFREILKDRKGTANILTGEKASLGNTIRVGAKDFLLLEITP